MVEKEIINSSFWKNKKVFLTGHTGFKGAWLSLWLKTLGAEVCGYSLKPPSKPSMFELLNISSEIESIESNIQDLNKLKEVFKNFKPEIVIHMAAQSLVRKSYKDPVETYATNVMGTLNVFEAIKSTNSVQVVLNITSDKCYENLEKNTGYSESDPMGGYDPYSSSKGCAELLTSAYRRSYFGQCNNSNVTLASARAGNVIGGGDFALDRLIPDIVRSILSNEELLIRNPNAIRPWQHVLEPLSGYITLIQKLWDKKNDFTEGWNFGPEESDVKSVEWIINEFSKNWDKKINWKKESNNQLHEAQILKLDCTKAKTKLGWYPQLKIEEGIQITAEWYKAFIRKDNLKDLTLGQIKAYEKNFNLKAVY